MEAPVHFYEPDGSGFVATDLATGPWDRRLQNGVALNALVAHLVELTPAPAPMVTARLVVDILKPTQMGRVEPKMIMLREGKRLQLFQLELIQNGAATVRATALRVRTASSPATDTAIRPGPAEGLEGFNSSRSAFRHVIETRLETGGLEVRGPGVVWARIFGEVAPGVAVSPFVQAAMAADFGSGLSSFVDWREWTFANVDISLHLTRSPQGEWVRVAAASESAGNGLAIVTTQLDDELGRFGHAHQTLFLDRRPTR